MQRKSRSSSWSSGRPAGIGTVLAFGLAVASGAAYAATDCAGLAGVTTPDSTVTSATVVAAGATVGGSVVPVANCRVQGVARPSIDSEIKWEVWLPQTAVGMDWTHEGQRHRRLRRRHALRAPRPGHRRRLRHRGQQHGARRRRIGRPGRSVTRRRSRTGACARTTSSPRRRRRWPPPTSASLCSTRTSRAARTAGARR